jgi:indole-3-glycerol phosphate synthase
MKMTKQTLGMAERNLKKYLTQLEKWLTLRMPNDIIKIAESLYVHDDITKIADEITKK